MGGMQPCPSPRPQGTPKNRLLDLPSKFFVGVNYWASHAGTAM